MFARIDNYDWENAFAVAGAPTLVEGEPPTTSVAAFTREDVKDIIRIEDGENDGPRWIGIFLLNDGRFAFVSAWCDYTGWG